MNRSKDVAAYKRILKIATQSEIARQLGISRQLVSRWESVPPRYAERIARWLQLDMSLVVPGLYDAVGDAIGDYSSLEETVCNLIDVFHPQPKASRCRKPKTRKKKPSK